MVTWDGMWEYGGQLKQDTHEGVPSRLSHSDGLLLCASRHDQVCEIITASSSWPTWGPAAAAAAAALPSDSSQPNRSVN